MSKATTAGVGLSKSQIKVLKRIYDGTDCSNEVYDCEILHPKQRPIAESMPELVKWFDGCVPVDGDGCSKPSYTKQRGYRLTTKGYEALTAHNPSRYPVENRRVFEDEQESNQ